MLLHAEPPGQLLQAGAVVTLADDLVQHIRNAPADLGQGPQDQVDPLVLLEPPQVDDPVPPLRRHPAIRRVEPMVHAAMDDAEAVRGDPPGHQVVPGALGQHREEAAAVDGRDEALVQVNVAGEREGRLLEDRGSEEMRHHRHRRHFRFVPGHEEGDLVDVLDDDVEPLGLQVLAVVGRGREIERILIPGPVHLRPAHPRPGRPAGKLPGQQRDGVPLGRQALHDLEDDHLGAPRLGVFHVAVGDDEDLQGGAPGWMAWPGGLPAGPDSSQMVWM